MWDISAAGHVEAGHGSLETAQRELQEEIGLALPPEVRSDSADDPIHQWHSEAVLTADHELQAFQHVLSTTHRSVLNDGAFVNNEHITVYFVRLPQRIPAEQFVLQESEVRPS